MRVNTCSSSTEAARGSASTALTIVVERTMESGVQRRWTELLLLLMDLSLFLDEVTNDSLSF